jgi:hypothetical protein
MTLTQSIRAAFNSPAKRSRPKNLRAILRGNAAGAIDLASVMVGVLVLGIIGGTISATVFAVIPWSQDEAAKSTLSSVRIAESTYLVNSPTGSYADLATLQGPSSFSASGSGSPRQPAASVTAAGAPLLQTGVLPLTVIADNQGWAAASTSASGAIFYATSINTTVSTDVPVLPDGLDVAALTGGDGSGDGGTRPVVVTPASQTVRLHLWTQDAASGPVWDIQINSVLGSASPYTASSPSPELPLLANPDLNGPVGTSPRFELQQTNGTLHLADGTSYALTDYSMVQPDFNPIDTSSNSHLDSVRMNIGLANYGASVSPWTSTDEAQAALVGAKIVFVQNGLTNTITISPDAVYTNTTT